MLVSVALVFFIVRATAFAAVAGFRGVIEVVLIWCFGRSTTTEGKEREI